MANEGKEDPVPGEPGADELDDLRPSGTFLQADIDRAVEYRKEYYKYVLTIVTSLLAFTVSFQPQLSQSPELVGFMYLGWLGLGVTVLAGVWVHMLWSKFFVSFRDFDNRGKRDQGKSVRRDITARRRFLDKLMMVGLAVGVVGVVAFAATNLRHVGPTAPTTSAEDTSLKK
jgi:multisubunit Na+/H+ antiporter MnhB subunit